MKKLRPHTKISVHAPERRDEIIGYPQIVFILKT